MVRAEAIICESKFAKSSVVSHATFYAGTVLEDVSIARGAEEGGSLL